MPTPEITLTATLQDFTGTDVAKGSLIICLCGFGAVLPKITGTSMLAKVGPLTFQLSTGVVTPSIALWGNDQITPSGTYYAISLMDDKKNVIQTGLYIFEGGVQSIDLSNATQVPVQPLPPPFNILFEEEPAGAFPGTVYTLTYFPLITLVPLQLYYNGNKLRKGIDFNLVGKTITLTFETQGPQGDNSGDNLYALYIPVALI